jgi:hypothetical protein
MSATTTFEADLAETQNVEGPTSRFAYRRFGPSSEPPLVLATRFRGTIITGTRRCQTCSAPSAT